MKLREMYKKHWMRIELILSICIALLIWIAWKFQIIIVITDLDLISLYLTQAQLDAELLGFMIATLAIIYTQLGVPRLKHVKNHPAFEMIWKTFINTIKYLATALISALLAIVLGFNELIVVFNLMAIIVSTTRVGRCVWILENVIKLSLEDPPIETIT